MRWLSWGDVVAQFVGDVVPQLGECGGSVGYGCSGSVGWGCGGSVGGDVVA
jgi:hypothetical protein